MSKKPNRKIRVPSGDVAKIIADVSDGWIDDIDDFIRDLTQFYGYDVVSKQGGKSRHRKRRATAYVLIGRKGEERSHIMTGKRRCRKVLKWEEKFERHALDVKYEFKTSNGYLPFVISDIYNGFIVNSDKFIQDLAEYYGYSIKKKHIRRREARTP